MRQRVAAVLILIAIGGPRSFGCAPAPSKDERIDVVEESAVIVWDPATKTEHFIRRATFHGEAKDFGFLVPTPTVPALAAIDDGLFDALREKTARKKVYTTRKEIDWAPLLAPLRRKSKGETVTAVEPVRVLAAQKVAGYDAVVLDASDASALDKWLSDHGYATTPDLAEWLDVYVRQQWKITAFKIDKSELAASTSAVKMSFATERPFFPYREPASQRSSDGLPDVDRSLAIWFLGPERVAGTIPNGTRWPGTLLWSDRIDATSRARFSSAAGVALAGNTCLSAFLDEATPRPGTDDLYFTRDPNQAPFIPPPEVIEQVEKTWIPIDGVLFSVGLLLLGVHTVRSRRSAKP